MRKIILLTAVILLISVFAMACSNSSNEPKQTGGQNTNQSSTPKTDTDNAQSNNNEGNDEGPISGGILKFAQTAEPTTLNPFVWASANDRNAFLSIFNSLMELDKQTLQPVPALIKEVKISDDGLTYDLTLQSGVTFHNGKAMTAEDVKYSLERASAEEATRTNALLKSIESIHIVDDLNITLKLSHVDSLLLDSFVGVYVVPNDPSIDHSNNPIGTGPFFLDSWVRNEKLVLKKNENYWKEGLPYLDGIEVLTVPDADVKTLQLVNGQVDIIDSVPSGKVEEVTNNPDLQAARVADDSIVANHVIVMNNTKAPFNNVKFRQAVSYALDREFIKQALFGNFVIRNTGVPSGDANYNPDIPQHDRDLEKAKQLLQESGYNNEKVELLYSTVDLMYVVVAQIVEQSLKEAGINVEMKSVEIAQWIDTVFNQKAFDMAISGNSPRANTVDILHNIYGKLWGGAAQWDDEEWLNRLLTVSQLSPEEGSKVLKELQAEIVELSPSVIVGGLVKIHGLSNSVQNFIPDPDLKMSFEAVWKK